MKRAWHLCMVHVVQCGDSPRELPGRGQPAGVSPCISVEVPPRGDPCIAVCDTERLLSEARSAPGPADVPRAWVKPHSGGPWLSSAPVLFPKVRHRWCELVIKHKYTEAYEQVERFLREDQVSVLSAAEIGPQHGAKLCTFVSEQRLSEFEDPLAIVSGREACPRACSPSHCLELHGSI